MNCKQAQRDIALWAGHDLDDPAQKESVRRHVTACPGCRTHYQQMKRTLLVLGTERPATYVSADSLWPELATRISHSQQHPSRLRNAKRFQGWMPFVAMTAACFILLLVVNEQPHQPNSLNPPGIAPSPVISSERASLDRYQRPEQKPREEPDAVKERYRLFQEITNPK